VAGARLRLGVIGMGFGRSVLLPALAGIGDAEVVAVAGGGAAETGLPVYPNGAALLTDAVVDAVVIAVPPAAQGALVRQALGRGLPTYCEKPLGLDLSETEALAAQAAKTGLPTAVGFMMRYDAGLAPLIAAVRDGAIGAVRHIDVTWTTGGGANPARPWSWRDDPAAGGGVLSEFCMHSADYCCLMAGDDVAAIACRTTCRVPERPTVGGERRAAPAEDEAELTLHFVNGITAHLLVGNTRPDGIGHRVEVEGTQGTAVFTHAPPFTAGAAQAVLDTVAGRRPLVALPLDPPAPSDSRTPAMRGLLRDFVAGVRGHQPPRLPGFADALLARRIVARAAAAALSPPAAP
jgi:predicted dehydrogenase